RPAYSTKPGTRARRPCYPEPTGNSASPADTRIGDQRTSEAAASTATSERLYREVLQQAPLGVMVWELRDPSDDESLTLVYANPTASELMGLEVAPALGKTMRELLPSVPPTRRQAYARVCRER